MESHKLNKLAEQYWQGACTEQEEQVLLEAIRTSTSVPDSLRELAEYLEFLAQERNETFLDADFDQAMLARIAEAPVKQLRWKMWASVAAGIALLGSIGFGVQQFSQPVTPPVLAQEDTYEDPAQALAEVKKALLLVSNNMNAGMEHTRVLTEFHKAKQELETYPKSEKRNEFN